jgi:hypothetical protein
VTSDFLVRHFHVFGVDIQGWMFVATALVIVGVYFSIRPYR